MVQGQKCSTHLKSHDHLQILLSPYDAIIHSPKSTGIGSWGIYTHFYAFKCCLAFLVLVLYVHLGRPRQNLQVQLELLSEWVFNLTTRTW